MSMREGIGMTTETDDVLAEDLARYEYPRRIVPWTGQPDTTDEDDDGNTDPATPSR